MQILVIVVQDQIKKFLDRYIEINRMDIMKILLARIIVLMLSISASANPTVASAGPCTCWSLTFHKFF